MSTVFLKILNIGITAGWLILAVILIRLLFKKAPKWLSCLLWGLVALRLLIPFSIESALSLIPSGEVVSESIVSNYSPSIDTGFVLVNNTLNPIINQTLAPRPEMKTNPMEIIVSAASIIWIAGMVAMLIYAAASYFLLKKRVSTAIPLIGRFDPKRRVLLCDGIKSPFILGIIRPAIYIPSNLDEETIEYVYAHENSHIRRRDNIWKPLGFILLCVYWFNPLCWIAYILLCKDIEAACDEKVIKDKEKDYLAFYSQALLNCAAPRKMISACPVAFGETGVKSRVKGILNYRKPAFWIILVSLIAVIAVGVCFLTNPKKEKKGDLKDFNPEMSVAFSDSEDFVPVNFSGFAPPAESLHEGENVIIEQVDLGTFIGTFTVGLHANENQDELILKFNEEPDEVKIQCMPAASEEDGLTPVYSLPYDKKSHTFKIKTDQTYAYSVETTWKDAGKGTFEFVVSGPGEEMAAFETGEDLLGSDVEHFTEFYALYETPEGFSVESTGNSPDDELKFKYKKVLVGRDPGAACSGMFIVHTNNPNITYEEVSRSIYSSDMNDWLVDTCIVDMKPLDYNFTGFSTWPTKSDRISADFDEKEHPETDIAGEKGDPVYSVSDGVIFSIWYDNAKGNSVEVLCGDALITYSHMESVTVNEFDEIKEGDIIGEMGSTGLSTGPHLGLSLTVNGTPENIMDYYEK